METGINIGVSKETVQEAGSWIMKILDSAAEEETIRAALETLRFITQVNNTAITNNLIGDHLNSEKEGNGIEKKDTSQ